MTWSLLCHDGKSSPPARGDFPQPKIYANALAAWTPGKGRAGGERKGRRWGLLGVDPTKFGRKSKPLIDRRKLVSHIMRPMRYTNRAYDGIGIDIMVPAFTIVRVAYLFLFS